MLSMQQIFEQNTNEHSELTESWLMLSSDPRMWLWPALKQGLNTSVPLYCACLSLSITNVVAGPVLVVLIMIARCPSAITIRELWKNKCVLLTEPGNSTAYLGPRGSGGWERERVLGPEVLLFMGVKSRAPSLLVNLKHKSRNLKWKRKNKWSKWSVIEINQDLYNKGAWVREGSLAVYLVVWPAMTLFEIVITEVDASLKWMPSQSKFKSGTCITKKKTNSSQCLHYSHTPL